MKLFTIGFTKKTAEQFFGLIKKNEIDLLIDVRLNNKTQLAGFTKGDDLAYFLSQICDCEYEHQLDFAPTKDLLDGYKDKKIAWSAYEVEFLKLLATRKACVDFISKYSGFQNIVLLCSEPTAERCHRRLLAESIANANSIESLTHI
jgi:uncharacterized protein (DUF488 family)